MTLIEPDGRCPICRSTEITNHRCDVDDIIEYGVRCNQAGGQRALKWVLNLIDKHRRLYPALLIPSEGARALDALREDVERERLRSGQEERVGGG